MDNYRIKKTSKGDFLVIPMRGGMVTIRERPLIPFGEKSLVQNMRCWHPGFETRKGYDNLVTVATNASSDSIKNLFQLSKGKRSEQALFVQYGNDDLYKQDTTMTIPTQFTGDFGEVIHTGSSGSIPASFGVVNDYMLYANGVDQHQIYAGVDQEIEAFIIVKDSAAHDHFPAGGVDGTFTLIDRDTSTTVAIDIGDYTNDFDAIYIMTKVPMNILNWTIDTANDAAATTMKVDYWTGTAWSTLTVTDGTASGGKPLAQTGTMTMSTLASSRTTEQSRYMFGQCGFWYKVYTADNGSIANCEVSQLTYGTYVSGSTSTVPLHNVWNSVETDMVQAFHYVDADGIYYNYAGDAVDIGGMTSSDFLYFASPYPLEAVYIDFGSTTNTTGADPTIKYWDGDSWATLTQLVDGTNEFLETGWLAWQRPTDEEKTQFNNTKYRAYWYQISVDATVDASTVISLLGMPYFNINDFGRVGYACGAWKNRGLYTFDKFPRDIYVSESGEHMKLNGSDFAILQPGDGRENATKAIANFYNEIMVFQEELGTKGGCVTIFEGYSPSTFGKIVLSTKLGTLNAKSVDVVDGSKSTLTSTQVNAQTMVFFLSHYGVFMSDGKVITGISDDIQNYFDERFSECIRNGYENEMWLSYDSTENMIKIGIVSGNSATTCNKFFCYDLTDGVWYEDVYADSMSCFRDVSSDTGQLHSIQISGGSTSGFLYQMNAGTNDNGTAIESKVIWEFSQGPFFINLIELSTRVKVQGDLKTYTWSLEENDVESDTSTQGGAGSMAAKNASETMARNRHLLKAGETPWISFTITDDTLDESLYIYDMGIIAEVSEQLG